MNLNLSIKSEYFHHHSDGILLKYAQIKTIFETALNSEIVVDAYERTKKSQKVPGITADSLNKALRERLKEIENLEFEVNQSEGIYYVSGQTNGFDFALVDQEANLVNFRNLCFGRRSLRDGKKEWKRFLSKNPKYKNVADGIGLSEQDEASFGQDIDYKTKVSPIILGEIQFGNWALAYRDLFKVLQANILTDVDALIYITADGELERLLSDGIVSFNKIKDIIQEFHKVVTVPIWLIGIDLIESKEINLHMGTRN